MTFHLNSHKTTDIKPEMLSGVQTGNGTPHGKYDIRGIAQAHKQKRRHFHAKTTSAKLYIHNGVGERDFYIDEAHTELDIFRFVAFLSYRRNKNEVEKVPGRGWWWLRIISAQLIRPQAEKISYGGTYDMTINSQNVSMCHCIV